MPQKDKWQSRAGRLICIAIILAGIYIALKYALGLLLPFLFALAIGLPVSALAGKSTKRLGGGEKAWAVFYIAVFWTVILVSVVLLIEKIGSEAGEMLSTLSENADNIVKRVEELVNSITELPARIPFFKELGGAGEYAKDAVSSLIEKIVAEGGKALASGVGRVVLKTPATFMSFIVCAISSIYIAIDWRRIKQYFFGLMSDQSKDKSAYMLSRIVKGAKGYLRAYFWLFAINFILLYIGLGVMGIRYAFLISLGIAFFDMLPLFSAGAILIPWGIILIIGESYLMGIGMIALFAVIAVVRQIAEPRLVGRGLGIHPLASLASMYIGFRAFGFWGMLLAPVCVLAVKEILETGKKGEKIEETT